MQKAYFFGIFPRSERLIDVTREKQDYYEDLMEESVKIAEYQREKGMKIISDPQMTWEDMLRPIAANSEGIEVNGLNRYFETNTFYKVPLIKGKVKLKDGVEGYFLSSRSKVDLISIPDPFTFYCMSRDSYYLNKEVLLKDLGQLLSDLAYRASRSGYSYLILKAPSYGSCSFSGLEEPIKEAIRGIKESFKGEVIAHLYFFRNRSALDFLSNTEVDGVGLDMFVYSIDDARFVGEKGKKVSMGLIDGANTKMEKKEEVLSAVDKVKAPEVYVSNNVDLEFLPQKFALKKVDLLAEIGKVV